MIDSECSRDLCFSSHFILIFNAQSSDDVVQEVLRVKRLVLVDWLRFQVMERALGVYHKCKLRINGVLEVFKVGFLLLRKILEIR